VTREDGDEDYIAERLALLILTKPGERVLVPAYGLRDPTFSEIDPALLSTQVEMFGPDVRIDGITTRPRSDTLSEITVDYSIDDSNLEGDE
jgi:phage baseplate assembly protein W